MLRVLTTWPAVIIYCTSLLMLVVVLRFVDISLLDLLAPSDREALSVIWQVHASVISIGFTGLAITFQLLSDPPVSAGPARRAVIQRIRFYQLLFFGVCSDIAIGMAAIWFQSDANVVFSFFAAFVPSITMIAATYWYSAHLFGQPSQVELITLEDVTSRVRNQAARLARNHARNQELGAKVESLPSLTSRPLEVDQANRKEIPYQGSGGVIETIQVERLGDLSGALSGIDSSDIESPAIAYIRVRVGDKVETDTVVGDVYSSNEVPDRTLSRLTKMLSDAIVVADENTIRAEDLVEREMQDLQEDLMGAIESQKYGRVERGFEYYERIISTVREVVSTQPGVTVFGFQSSWNWLTTHLFEVNDAAARSNDRVAMAATAAAYGRCHDAVKGLDVDFFSSAVQSYPQIYSTMLEKVDGYENALEHLLVSFHNLTEFVLPYREGDQDTVSRLVAVAIDAWLELVRAAYGSGSEHWSGRAYGYYSGLFEFGSKGELYRQEVTCSKIVLLAWLLYSQDLLGVDTQVAVKEVLKGIPDERILSVVLTVTEREHDSTLRRWEMADSLPLKARIVRASDYLSRAAILVLSKRPRSVPVEINSGLHQFAQAALSEVEPLRASWRDAWGLRVEDLDFATTLLEGIADRWNVDSKQRIRETPLDPARVQLVKDAISVELAPPNRLIRFLDTSSKPDGFTADPDQRVGRTIPVPRYYFVPTDDIYVDTAELGRAIARSVRSAEEDETVRRLLRYRRTATMDVKELPAQVLRWARRAESPFVVVFNSFEVRMALGFDHERGHVVVDKQEVDAAYVFSDAIDEHVALVDRAHAPGVVRSADAKPGLIEISRRELSIEVRDTSAESSGEPLVDVEYGARLSWLMPDDGDVLFVRVSGVSY